MVGETNTDVEVSDNAPDAFVEQARSIADENDNLNTVRARFDSVYVISTIDDLDESLTFEPPTGWEIGHTHFSKLETGHAYMAMSVEPEE